MKKFPKIALILILIGSILWSLTMVKSGLIYPFGMGFWGPNGHDGVWHIAVINGFIRGSNQMPVFAGEILRNYHIGFDAILAIIARITSIPSHNLYFQIVPPLLAIFSGVLTYKLVYLWKKSRQAAFWSTFFVYFGGSFGWLLTLFKNGEIGGECAFWSQQSISTLINPPFALSFVVMLLGLISLQKASKSNSFKQILITSLLFGILIQIKAYAGLLSLFALFVVGTYMAIKKKEVLTLKIFALSFVFSLVLFLPFVKSASSLVVFKPFWFLETMMGLPDRVGWERFYSAMTNYKLAGNWLKGILVYLVAFIIFWYGNMGTRALGEIEIAGWIKQKKIGVVEGFFLLVISAGVVIPMLFLQKGTPWNTIQFFYYSLMFSGIIAGISFSKIIEKKQQLKNVLIGIVLALTLPTTIGTLPHYLPSRPPAKISNQELEALDFLSKKDDGVVLTYPFDEAKAKEAVGNPPRPLYLYESTAYVSAFGKKPVYLEDQVNLDITGYDWLTRRENVINFLNTLDEEKAGEFLKINNIRYIYWITGQRSELGEEKLGIERIFENNEVNIYQVKDNF